ncbi:MAG: formylglycine-generating enzyme family protein [Ginsengibacter sp.]
MKYFLTILFLTAFSGVSHAQEKAVIAQKKMVTVPAGNYKPFFVTKSDKPIYIAAFKMDETAVTNLEYLEFVKANPQWRRSKVNRLFADANYLKYWESDLSIGASNKNIYHSPVVYVSWFAAQAYCKWKNKKLPTVAEWEQAGHAAPKDIKYKSLTDYILEWYSKPNPTFLPPVKSTYKNEYGLYDMHVLIWEWTFNFNSFIGSTDTRGNNQVDLKNFCAAGAVNVADKSDYASFLRFSYRGSLKGNFCIANLGFRCAKDLK